MTAHPSPGNGRRSSGVTATNRRSADLRALLDNEVTPRLRAEELFPDDIHHWHKSGTRWRGQCPFHEKGRTGTSFYIDADTKRWRCSVCNIGGGPIQYLWKRKGGVDISPRGQDFIDLVRELCQQARVPFPERELSPKDKERARLREARRAILESVSSICQDHLRSEAGRTARAYLAGRGFDEEACRNLGAGLYPLCPELRSRLLQLGHNEADVDASDVVFQKMAGYIVFPWHDEWGAPLTLYGTWSGKEPPHGVPKKMALPNPKERGESWEQTKRSPLYFDRARRAGHQDLVLVEGVLDAALLQVRGDTRVVACAAASLSKLQAETLARHGVRSVTIVLDPDNAGEKGIGNCIQLLDKVGIRAYIAPPLPDGLDPDDFLLQRGMEAWKEHVAQAMHGYRHLARCIIAQQGERVPGDDGWGDRIIDRALAFAAGVPPERKDEMHRHFWPEILQVTGAHLEDLQRRLSASRNGKVTPAGSSWPQPIDFTAPPSVPPFPLHVLPEGLQRFVGEVALALNCPPDFAAVPLLVLAGAAIGNTHRLAITKSHSQSACLFAVLVACPGSAKSPALEKVKEPFEEAERRFIQKARDERKEWRQKHSKEDEDEAEKPPPPRRCLLDDTTTEAMAKLLSENPRGVGMVRDELAALVCGLNEYKGGRGHDRQVYLQLWGGGTGVPHEK